jgi:hypothetical protein
MAFQDVWATVLLLASMLRLAVAVAVLEFTPVLIQTLTAELVVPAAVPVDGEAHCEQEEQRNFLRGTWVE